MESEINKALNTLRNKQILLYPTDTIWGIGCDATSEQAISKIFKIKERNEQKSLVILVDSIEMLEQYVSLIPPKAKEVLKNAIRPTTIIFNNPKGLASNAVAKNDSVAIRIVQDKFCNQLIKQFGKPIISTSANKSGNQTPTSFAEIVPAILEAVDYVVNLHRDKRTTQASRIIKILENNELQILRK